VPPTNASGSLNILVSSIASSKAHTLQYSHSVAINSLLFTHYDRSLNNLSFTRRGISQDECLPHKAQIHDEARKEFILKNRSKSLIGIGWDNSIPTSDYGSIVTSDYGSIVTPGYGSIPTPGYGSTKCYGRG
jgi:hypothetical protein